MNEQTTSLVQEAINHLAEILSGTCRITVEQLLTIQDSERAELFAGLLFLHEDLELRQRETLQAQAQRNQAHKAALHRSRQQFELVMSQFNGIFWVLDHDLVFLQVSESGADASDPLQPKAEGSLGSLIATNDPLFLSCRGATLGTRSTLDWVWRGRTYQATIAPFAFSPDAPVGAAVVAFDVTEQRQLQDRLNQANVLKEVFTVMQGTVAYEVKHWGEVDEEIIWVAGATERIFGITHEEWTQGGAFEFVQGKDSYRKAYEAATLIAKGEPTPMVELQAAHKEGKPMVVMLDKISRHLPNGNLLIVNHDITAEVELRELMEEHVIQKAIASRFKAATAYLSHEIRNQLYPHSMILELLKEDVPEHAADIDLILDANRTVTSILNHVLELAKWESGEFPIDVSLFPMKRLFRSIGRYAKVKGGTIRGIEAIEDTWYVRADEHILKQACTNLISNGDKFRGNSDLTVTFSFEQSSRKAGTLVVVVEDGGRGMTPEQLSHVMVPFGQIRKASQQHSGTGLGLPITKAMIEVGHGGKLTLESAGLGEGTRATVRVPVEWLEQQESQDTHETPMWWVTADPDAAIDVLVVDDLAFNRKATVRACTRLGLTHEQAGDGQQAIEMMAVKKYSMVIMDQQMPAMNGDEAVEQARKAGYSGPIVMVSGDTLELSEQADMRERGITAFLQKMAVPGPRDALKQLAVEKKKIQPT